MRKQATRKEDADRLRSRVNAIIELRSIKASPWSKKGTASANTIGNLLNGRSHHFELPTAMALASAVDIPVSILTLEMSDEDFDRWVVREKSGGQDESSDAIEQFKALLDRIPPEKIPAAWEYLEFLASSKLK